MCGGVERMGAFLIGKCPPCKLRSVKRAVFDYIRAETPRELCDNLGIFNGSAGKRVRIDYEKAFFAQPGGNG